MEPPSTRSECINHSDQPIDTTQLAHALDRAFDLHNRKQASACVLITSDQHIRELNARFRNLDETTDVLTFTSGEQPNLGDIAISIETAQKQANSRGVPLHEELMFLAIHGALHLLGFDDQTEPERARMVDEMNRVAVSLGLKADTAWSSLLHAGHA